MKTHILVLLGSIPMTSGSKQGTPQTQRVPTLRIFELLPEGGTKTDSPHLGSYQSLVPTLRNDADREKALDNLRGHASKQGHAFTAITA